MSDLCFMPAHQLKSKLLNKDISASELLELFIKQISLHNKRINALVSLDLEAATRTAKKLDDYLLKQGQGYGMLHGLPISVKDVFATQGLRTTYGNPNFVDYVPPQDDWLVAREKAAGAIILGKSNTPDCASGGITTNSIFGLTRNPWNLEKTTSGSSGGSVASLASGMVAIADGSDIGGSLRSPAAFTNCVGFRPSSGRIPGPVGSLADGNTSTAGAFTRCVADTALFMQACDGPHIQSATPYPAGPKVTLDALSQLPKGLIASWSQDFADREMDSQISALFEAHRKVFEDLGIQLSNEPLDLGHRYRNLYEDFNAYAYVKGLPGPVLKDCLKGLPVKPSIKLNVDHYLNLTALEVFAMFKQREQLKVTTQAFMQKHSVIITPAHNCLAYGVNDEHGMQKCDWSAFYLAPLLGLPSIVVPMGFTRDLMPHGVMITGRKGDDLLVLQIAAAFEAATGYGMQRPTLSL